MPRRKPAAPATHAAIDPKTGARLRDAKPAEIKAWERANVALLLDRSFYRPARVGAVLIDEVGLPAQGPHVPGRFIVSPDARAAGLDLYMDDHLTGWLTRAIPDASGRAQTRALILSLVKRHPDMITRGDSWPEIWAIAERNRQLGLG